MDNVGARVPGSMKNTGIWVAENTGQGFLTFRKDPEVVQICPEMHANEMQALYNKHHKVSSHIKVHQNTHDSVRHEVI